MSERSTVHSSFVVERTYPAAPTRVFQAFADPKIKRRWFVEGEGWQVETYDVDFRAGGHERSTFRYQGGPLISNDTIYHDIVTNRRIVISYAMAIAGKPISVSLATMEFESAGEGTRFVFTEQDTFLDGFEDKGGREEGTRGLLDALAAELQRSSAAV